ncbi:hypothetical protein [Fodinibius salsisoli]|uniref:Uncharacterized protein n=1 Tax=Fodinibius salsisoli TaxID=2820877 RepID=A0ABT3PK31_9BACT|nr:hypothetical protein [Fodinibius salsisoli]MCW9706311.1 hypothetical protein [Fodinibius salsisoli]
MTAFNKLPGWKIKDVNWSIWTWLLIQFFKLLQTDGIIGSVTITLNIILPSLSIISWTVIVTMTVALLVFRGYYQFVEWFSLLLIAFFTFLTFASVFLLQERSYAFSLQDILSGITLELPPALVGDAIAAFGITGIGGDEIMYYNYWSR